MRAGAAIFWTLVMLALFIAAIWVAITGNMLTAIFLAILWVGIGNNMGHAFSRQ